MYILHFFFSETNIATIDSLYFLVFYTSSAVNIIVTKNLLLILTVALVRHIVEPAIHHTVAPQLIGYAVTRVLALKPRARPRSLRHFGPSCGEPGAITRFVGHYETILYKMRTSVLKHIGRRQ